MFRHKSTEGYSIVEVMVAVTVLLLAIVGPITIASKGLKSAAYAREQNTAFFLAQEAIEIVVKLRNEGILNYQEGNTADIWDWTDQITNVGCTSLVPCGVNAVDGGGSMSDWSIFRCDSTTVGSCELYQSEETVSGNTFTKYTYNENGELSGYERDLYLTVLNDEYVEVRVVVRSPNTTRPLEINTYLYNIYDDI
ncbi:hypothetical protein KC722_00040 [Candidatus Kaiserbacteria bacterium]|nr:hypothetical protein [Candidatus Kaiserbacteria bacterium]MCB9811347.1 hypothetical protein [Candidatus Nomurabacteria bacterium]